MNLADFVPVVGYDFPYMVNQDGDVYSPKLKRLLKQKIVHSGYAVVRLAKNGKSYCTGVHRLVAIAFIHNSVPEKNIINHKDGNKLNNNVSNLEWCTNKYNSQHFIEQLEGAKTKAKGYGWNKKALFTNEEVNFIRKLRGQGKTLKQIQNLVSKPISLVTISQICLMKIYKHVMDQ